MTHGDPAEADADGNASEHRLELQVRGSSCGGRGSRGDEAMDCELDDL